MRKVHFEPEDLASTARSSIKKQPVSLCTPTLKADRAKKRQQLKDAQFINETIEKGNEFLQSQEYDQAISLYSKIINMPGLQKMDRVIAYERRSAAFGGKGDFLRKDLDVQMASKLRQESA